MSKRKAELRKLLYSMAKYDSARSNSYLTACQENSTDVSKKEELNLLVKNYFKFVLLTKIFSERNTCVVVN